MKISPMQDLSPRWIPFLLFLIALTIFLPRRDHMDGALYNIDEATTAVFASVIADRGTPYLDVVDARPPLTHYIYAFSFLISGRHDLTPVHVFLTILICAEAVLIYLLTAFLHSRKAGILAAVLFAITSFNYNGEDMLAFHTEWTLIFFTTAGALLLLKGLENHRATLFGASGAVFGLAVLSKPPAGMDFLAAMTFLVMLASRGGAHSIFRKYLALFSAGFAVLLAAFGLYYISIGAWNGFYEAVLVRNYHYVSIVPVWQRIVRACATLFNGRSFFSFNFFPLAAVLLYVGIPRVRSIVSETTANESKKAFLPGAFLSLWFVSTYIGASFSGRDFGHYFIQTLPPLCIIAGMVFSCIPCILKIRAGFPLTCIALTLFYPLINLFGVSSNTRKDWFSFPWLVKPPAHQRPYQEIGESSFLKMVSYIKAQSGPDDPIFVWGFMPTVYLKTGRIPASRYIICNTLTGFLPWENAEHSIDTSRWIMRGSWDKLVRDLERSRPRFIIDTSPSNWYFYGKYPMEKYGPLNKIIKLHYQPDRFFDENGVLYYRVYRRIEEERAEAP